jgi:membrane protease YdiL (CAAX protease family)
MPGARSREAADPMRLKELKDQNSFRTLFILVTVTVLYIIFTYQGSADFYLLHLSRARSFLKSQAHAQYYQWSQAFFLMGVVPLCIVLFVFRERPGGYGVGVPFPLKSILITVLGVVVVTPFTYFGSLRPDLAAVYPLVLNAGGSPLLFAESSLFYFLYYVGYEICFRGYLFMGIRRDVGNWQALGVSLIATVLLHVGKPQSEMLMALLAGVAFPIIVWRLKSVWPAVFIHAYAGISLDYWILLRRGAF